MLNDKADNPENSFNISMGCNSNGMESQQMTLFKACEGFCKHPRLLKVEGFRWTITQPDDQFYKDALKLERRLQELTKRPIELMFTKLEDKNKRAGRNGRE